MIEGLVSTVVPVYNRATMVREAIDSVLAQTWRPVEIIIVDDGSTDDTVAVEADLCHQYPDIVRVIRQANFGPGVARQRGLEAAEGEFIQFLDSDDLLLPDKFALQVSGLRNDRDADISYGKVYARVREKRLAQPAQRTGERVRTLFPTMLQEPIWPTMTPLYRHAALKRIGPWPRKRQLEDWEYDAQAAACGLKLHYVDAFVAETRNHGQARLCRQWQDDDDALRDRVSAYVAVFGHAQRAGIQRESPEMQRFARSLFWMARVASVRGLSSEAMQLIDLARAASITGDWQLRSFELAGAIAGWRRAGRWAERLVSMTR